MVRKETVLLWGCPTKKKLTDLEAANLYAINVTERSKKLLRDVRLRGGLNVRCCSALRVKRLSESVSLSERFI